MTFFLGDAFTTETTQVYEHAQVSTAQYVADNARIYGNAMMLGNNWIGNNNHVGCDSPRQKVTYCQQ